MVHLCAAHATAEHEQATQNSSLALDAQRIPAWSAPGCLSAVYPTTVAGAPAPVRLPCDHAPLHAASKPRHATITAQGQPLTHTQQLSCSQCPTVKRLSLYTFVSSGAANLTVTGLPYVNSATCTRHPSPMTVPPGKTTYGSTRATPCGPMQAPGRSQASSKAVRLHARGFGNVHHRVRERACEPEPFVRLQNHPIQFAGLMH